jgi:membrane associated rhomboid family serine protease
VSVTARANKPVELEQARENVNSLRFLGGLLLMVALLLYFFHLAESPMGRHTLGILSAFFAVLGAALLLLGRRKIRSLR